MLQLVYITLWGGILIEGPNQSWRFLPPFDPIHMAQLLQMVANYSQIELRLTVLEPSFQADSLYLHFLVTLQNKISISINTLRTSLYLNREND